MPKAANPVPGGAILLWYVDDVDTAFKQLLSLGAREYEPVTPRSGGFITASVIDPFGNILGIMYNPHYLEILAQKKDDLWKPGSIGGLCCDNPETRQQRIRQTIIMAAQI